MEKPWKDNQPCISCVPAGDYVIFPTKSPKFGNAYAIENYDLGVSLMGNTKRTHILVHKANKESELLGCIAPVSSYGILDDEWAGFNSAAAFARLKNLLGDNKHNLTIERH
jgi:hypothetical protein